LKPFYQRPKKGIQFNAIIHERSKIQAMPLQTFSGVVWEAELWAKTRLTTVPHLKLHNLGFSTPPISPHGVNALTIAK